MELTKIFLSMFLKHLEFEIIEFINKHVEHKQFVKLDEI